MELKFKLWLENSHGVAKEPRLPHGPGDLPYTEDEHEHARSRLWVYECPRCGGDAYNGVPGKGMHYRGSAKCSMCHEGFAVVIPGIRPKHKDGPEVGYVSDDMRRQSAELDAWLKANSPARQDEARRHRVPPPVKYDLPLARMSSDMSRVNGAGGYQAWEEVGDLRTTSMADTAEWMARHGRNTTKLGGQMSDEEFHAFYGLPTHRRRPRRLKEENELAMYKDIMSRSGRRTTIPGEEHLAGDMLKDAGMDDSSAELPGQLADLVDQMFEPVADVEAWSSEQTRRTHELGEALRRLPAMGGDHHDMLMTSVGRRLSGHYKSLARQLYRPLIDVVDSQRVGRQEPWDRSLAADIAEQLANISRSPRPWSLTAGDQGVLIRYVRMAARTRTLPEALMPRLLGLTIGGMATRLLAQFVGPEAVRLWVNAQN